MDSPQQSQRTLINLFDLGGTLAKYAIIYGTTARSWEAANGQGTAEWHRHCLGAAMASILLQQPTPTGAANLTEDQHGGES